MFGFLELLENQEVSKRYFRAKKALEYTFWRVSRYLPTR